MKRLFAAAVLLALMAGCAVNENFVYKPAGPVAGGPKLPVKVAVLPFEDGTEDFTKRTTSSGGYVNLAKSGIDYRINFLPPDQWGKAFADDLASSGAFPLVRFVYDASEAADDEVVIAGIVTKAYLSIHGRPDPSLCTVSLNARTGKQGRVFWEKITSREEILGIGYGEGCGFERQCAIDQCHTHFNRILRGVFLEARQDLIRTLVRDGVSNKDAPSSKISVPESVDRLIEHIIKEK